MEKTTEKIHNKDLVIYVKRLDNASIEKWTRKKSLAFGLFPKVSLVRVNTDDYFRKPNPESESICLQSNRFPNNRIDSLVKPVDQQNLNANSNVNTHNISKSFRTINTNYNTKSAPEAVSHTGSICGKILSSQKSLENHKRIHTLEKPFTCVLCSHRFFLKEGLRGHLKSIHGVKRSLSCRRCSAIFPDISSLTKHPCTGNGSSVVDKTTHSCRFCQKVFSSQLDLRRHMSVHTGEAPYVCPECDKNFKRRDTLVFHMRSVHGVGLHQIYACGCCDKMFTDGKALQIHVGAMHPSTVAGSHRCPFCGKLLSSANVLEDHLRRHTKERPYKCKICKHSFHQRQSWRDHLHRKHNVNIKEVYFCNFCDDFFMDYPSFELHTEKEHSHKSYECDICRKCFNRNSHLVKHKRVHNKNKKRFPCTVCNKRFLSETTLNKHALIHRGCEFCKKVFATMVHLNTHMRVHTRERPFMCKECGKTFTQKPQLIKHTQGHNVNLKCELCKMNFGTIGHFKRHFREKHRDQLPFQCTMCDRRFFLENNVVAHQRRVHSEERQFPCTVCGKRYISKLGLSRHIAVHSRTHVCNICDKQFATKSTLELHVKRLHRIKDGKRQQWPCKLCENDSFLTVDSLVEHVHKCHEKEKQIFCKKCGKFFANPMCLNKHTQIHITNRKRPFSCNTCSKKFLTNWCLQRHEAVHVEVKPFSCGFCSQTFSFKGSLNAHVRIHTGEKPFSCEKCGNTFFSSNSLRTHSILCSADPDL